MDFPAIKAGLRTAVEYALGIETETRQVAWHGEPRAQVWASHPHVTLELLTVRALGVDEDRLHYDPVTGRNEVEHAGPRLIEVRVRIETDDQIAAEAIGSLAARLRARMRSGYGRSYAALQAAGLGVAEIAPTVSADFTQDGRRWSASITDLTLCAAESDLETVAETGPEADVGVVEAAVITPVLDGIAGTPETVPDPA